MNTKYMCLRHKVQALPVALNKRYSLVSQNQSLTPHVVLHSYKFESCTRPKINERGRKLFISALEQCELSSLIESRGCALLLHNMLLRAKQMSCMNTFKL
jgi:hypothetical protein